MKIDDPITANILTEKISATIPFKVYLGKPLLKISKKDGHKTDPKTAFEVDWAGYSGDEGGIMFALKNSLENGEMYVTSITHIKIDPEHPLAAEIEAYQQERTMKLAIQDSKGFLKEFVTERSPKPKSKRRKRGFGQL
jgi:hypothetical protein